MVSVNSIYKEHRPAMAEHLTYTHRYAIQKDVFSVAPAQSGIEHMRAHNNDGRTRSGQEVIW